MSTWVPPASIPALNDGDPLAAKPLKDLVASLQAFLNGAIGNVNILVPLDPSDKIAYAKLDLVGQIQAGDIAGISFSTFTTLKAKAQASPNNTVVVQAGTYLSIDGLATRVYAGGNSGAFGNTSGAGQNRVDVLTINDAGALGIVAGVEAGAPVAPNYPANVIAIAEVYIRFSGIGVVIKDTDDTVNSYIKTDARSLIKFTGVPNDSITVDQLADGAAGFVNRLEGVTDLADPGTSFVTMTDMSFTNFNGGQAGAGAGAGGCLLDFDAVFELKQATNVTAFPAVEVRLMVGNAGAAVEVHRAAIDLQSIITDSASISIPAGAQFILPLHLSYQCVFPTGGLKDARIEWRRVGAAGTPTVRQIGATYKRVFNMTTIRRATVTP